MYIVCICVYIVGFYCVHYIMCYIVCLYWQSNAVHQIVCLHGAEEVPYGPINVDEVRMTTAEIAEMSSQF